MTAPRSFLSAAHDTGSQRSVPLRQRPQVQTLLRGAGGHGGIAAHRRRPRRHRAAATRAATLALMAARPGAPGARRRAGPRQLLQESSRLRGAVEDASASRSRARAGTPCRRCARRRSCCPMTPKRSAISARCCSIGGAGGGAREPRTRARDRTARRAGTDRCRRCPVRAGPRSRGGAALRAGPAARAAPRPRHTTIWATRCRSSANAREPSAATARRWRSTRRCGDALQSRQRSAPARQLQEALSCSQRAIALDTGWSVAHNNLGLVLGGPRAPRRSGRELPPGGETEPPFRPGVEQPRQRAVRSAAITREALRLPHARPSSSRSAPTVTATSATRSTSSDSSQSRSLSFRRALALQPDYAQAHLGLATALRLQGRASEAQRVPRCARRGPRRCRGTVPARGPVRRPRRVWRRRRSCSSARWRSTPSSGRSSAASPHIAK